MCKYRFITLCMGAVAVSLGGTWTAMAAGPAQKAGQPTAPRLVALTTKGGLSLAEVLDEPPGSIKVYDLKAAQDVVYPRADVLEMRTEGVPSNTDLNRLGRFPENLATYFAWYTKRSSASRAAGRELVLALLPIPDTGGAVTPETTQREEELTGALVRRDVPMVERARLAEVMGELNLQQGAAFDNAMAVKIGKQAGANAVVVGSLTAKDKKADLNLRLVDVETGRLMAAPSLKDIEGLPQKRGVVAAVSLAGSWDVLLPNGATVAAHFALNGTASSEIANGQWQQNGTSFVVQWRPKAAAKKKKGAAGTIRWKGELGPLGRAFKATSADGGTISGRKR